MDQCTLVEWVGEVLDTRRSLHCKMLNLHQKPKRIILVGFMCSGKSTVGRALAKVMELPFIDIDRVVEERVGPLVPFIQEKGEQAFRELENEVLRELLKGPNAVIATGGGTPCSNNNMAAMKANGITVWLDVPMEYLMPLIEQKGGDRPLLFGLKGAELRDRVMELFAPREPIYAQADLIVQGGAEPSVVVDRIELALKNW